MKQNTLQNRDAIPLFLDQFSNLYNPKLTLEHRKKWKRQNGESFSINICDIYLSLLFLFLNGLHRNIDTIMYINSVVYINSHLCGGLLVFWI